MGRLSDRKERIKERIIRELDEWIEEEEKSIERGSGMRGPCGTLSGVDLGTILNEVFWRLM